jgi:predicted permease
MRPGIRRLFSLRTRDQRRIEREVEDEMATHIELRVAQLIARGLAPEDAEREARSRFGNFREAQLQLKHSAATRERHMYWRTLFDAVSQDFRVSLRRLARAPGFALAVSLTLALGIGANAAMFGIVDRLLLRPPEYLVDADRVVTLGAQFTYDGGIATQQTFPYHTYKAFHEGLTKASIVGMSTFPQPMPFGRGVEAQVITGVQTNVDYFPMIGVKPARGRFFLEGDDREPVGEPVIVISHAFWQRQYGGDNSAVGKSITLGDQTFTIVGVAPQGFTGFELTPVDVWIPITSAGSLRAMRTNDWMTTKQSTWIRVYARLRDDASPQQIAAEATPINEAEGEPRLREQNAKASATLLMDALRESRGQTATVAKLLAGLSLIVVLIACTNVVNLMLSRAVSRRQEVAVRLALGVTRTRLAIQLLCETFMLALLGAVGAAAIAWIGGTGARILIFGESTWGGSPIDMRMAIYIALTSIAAALVAGLVPLLQSGQLTLTSTLKSGAREGRRSGDRTRGAILVSQAALSVLLLVTTGLFWRSLQAVNHVSLGMDAQHLMLARVDTRVMGATPQRADELYHEMARRVRSVPGVRAVTISNTVAGWNSMGTRLFVPGRDSVVLPEGGGPYLNGVEPGFFAAVNTRILEGRDFTDADNATALPVAIVNQTMARMLWPDANAVGQCIKLDKIDSPCTTVIGVAENSRRQNWIEEEIFHVMRPLTQSPSTSRILLVRAANETDGALIGRIQQSMRSAEANLPFADVRPLTSLYENELRPWRLGAGILGAFASLALFLVAVGLFATISFSVTQRTHEIGVRMALGARAGQVVRLVMRQGFILAAAGSAAGVMLALAGGRYVQDMLYQVSPKDAGVFAVTLLVLGTIATLATALPAFRASRVNPVRALRSE